VHDVLHLEAQDLGHPDQMTQFINAWPASWNQQDAADLEQWRAQLGDDR